MTSLTFLDCKLGQTAAFAKTISETDVYLFAGITGDFNPAHVDAQYASGTKFGKRIAHGILVSGLISTVIGTALPGPGALYVSQELRFLAPVYMGDTITAKVEVVDLITERKCIRLRTTCTNQDGVMVIDGAAVVSPRRA